MGVVVGHLSDTSLLARDETLEGVLARLEGTLEVVDVPDAGEVLDDKLPNGSAVDFSFAQPMRYAWVLAQGGDARADPYGGTPADTRGVPCMEAIPTPLMGVISVVKVYAAPGVRVTVWGQRYG